MIEESKLQLYISAGKSFDDFLAEHPGITDIEVRVNLRKKWKELEGKNQFIVLPQKIEKTGEEIQRLESKVEELNKRIIALRLKNDNRRNYLQNLHR
jgi:poly-D-alanine transfer protein DltD